MTQENKDLLLKDISARLPYGVKAYVKNWSNFKTYEDVYVVKSTFPSLNEVHVQSETGSLDVIIGYYDYEFKPYLFPMSYIDDNEKLFAEYITTLTYDSNTHSAAPTIKTFDFYNKHHIDYRSLIPMGLALDATDKNIY